MENEDKDRRPDDEAANGQQQPPRPDGFDVEQEWAEKLGMDFDARRAATPPPVPGEGQACPPPVTPQAARDSSKMYVMPPGEELPERTPQPPMPPTYMVWAILSMLCCCFPAGIVATIYAASVSSRYFARDFEGARRASRNAEIWIIVSIVAGIVSNALYVPLTLLMP